MTKRNKNEHGQVIAFVVLSLISLSLLWMMLINIANLVKDRIMMQNAVDCAAQSAACIRARGLNKIGFLNSLLGGVIQYKGLGIPGVPFARGFSWIPYLGAKKTYLLAKSISKTQEGILMTYGGGLAYWSACNTATAQDADGITYTPGTFSLGLERDRDEVNFYDTIIVKGVPLPKLDTPLTKEIKTWCYLEDRKSPKKNVIITHKKSKLEIFGKGSFNIKKSPGIRTIAAARPYNKHGSMFPVSDNAKFGISVIILYIKAADGYNAQLVPVGFPFQH